MSEIFLYNHGGSGNHGCEALVRTICAMFNDGKKLKLLSEAPQQDIHYNIQKVVDVQPATQAYSKLSINFLKAYFRLKRTGDYFSMDVLPYIKSLNMLGKGDVEISVGGDIYCYEDYPKFIKLHEMICKRGCKTILLGCSLEKELFEDSVFIDDMRNYDYISARESLTYHLLKKAGFTKIGYAPDSAFTLPAENLPVPAKFQEYNTIGLNVSPLVEKKELKPGIMFLNYECLIQWILENTDSSIALIPHVVWRSNDDRKILEKLYDEFRDTERVILIPDCNCMQLKGFISRCRIFVGARTHATIAAYSSCVPTLVLGYSIKSRGIATDLFGTDENFVLPIQKLKHSDDLTKAFQWILKNEEGIHRKLKTIMPGYIEMAKCLEEVIRTV